MTGVPDLAELAGLYRDLHAHPELAFAEHRTARIVAARLTDLGYATTAGVGRTGVVGVLSNGDGPTVLLRADMDALPVREQTGLDYASTARATDASGQDVPVMHACGHDMHVTCLLGAASDLAARQDSWRGTLILVFQPSEEVGEGARAMIDDGLYTRFPVPDIVLGQHVAPLPAGVLGVHAGPAFAAADALRVVLHGQGGHGSRPEATVDPVVMAAATVLRLQGVVSRELAGGDTAVLTVGALHAGSAPNIIPDQAELLLSLRSFDDKVRDKALAAIARIVRAEAAASGAPQEPEITTTVSFPPLVNDPAACARLTELFNGGAGLAIDPGQVTGSEDVGLLATAAGVPCAYWLLGGADPAHFAGITTLDEARDIVDGLPSNHSPLFAPVVEPTLRAGIAALTAAARGWLAQAPGQDPPPGALSAASTGPRHAPGLTGGARHRKPLTQSPNTSPSTRPSPGISPASCGATMITPSAPAARNPRACASNATRSAPAPNTNTVFVISAGSRPTRSQCPASTANLCRTTSASPPNTLHASP